MIMRYASDFEYDSGFLRALQSVHHSKLANNDSERNEGIRNTAGSQRGWRGRYANVRRYEQ